MVIGRRVPHLQGRAEIVFSSGGAGENPVEVVRSCVCQITFGEDFFCDAALSRGPFRRRILRQ